MNNRDYIYVGQITSLNKPEGLGRMIFDDNSMIEGLFKNGYPNGKCRCVRKDGNYYETNWMMGKENGNAVEYFFKDESV